VAILFVVGLLLGLRLLECKDLISAEERLGCVVEVEGDDTKFTDALCMSLWM
jgi:hypothetical protein